MLLKKLVCNALMLSLLASCTEAISPARDSFSTSSCDRCPEEVSDITGQEQPSRWLGESYDAFARCEYLVGETPYSLTYSCVECVEPSLTDLGDPTANEAPGDEEPAECSEFPDGTCDTDKCTDTCGCPDGGCPPATAQKTARSALGALTKLGKALFKMGGVYCHAKAAYKAVALAAKALVKARASRTILDALLVTFPKGNRTAVQIAQIQQEAMRAAANYARAAAAAKVALKQAKEILSKLKECAALGAGYYLFGSKEADEEATKEIEEGLKEADEEMKKAEEIVKGDVELGPDAVDVAPKKKRINAAIAETLDRIKELEAKEKAGTISEDEKALLAAYREHLEDLRKEKNALPK